VDDVVEIGFIGSAGKQVRLPLDGAAGVNISQLRRLEPGSSFVVSSAPKG